MVGLRGMSSLFECEVRFPIADIGIYKRRILGLGGKLIYKYEFDDYYYYPGPGVWDPVEKILRIRHWLRPRKPTTIYFVQNAVIEKSDLKFKRSVYPEGKLPLFSGELDRCQEVLCDLGFKEWFVVKKRKAEFWEIPAYGFETVFEFIPGLGWSGELEEEGKDIQKAKKRLDEELKLLGVDLKKVDYRPISVIYAEHLGILK